MIIIGERLNSSRLSVRQALEKKDESFLVNEALKQKQAGADILDLNVSALPEREIELLRWAVPLLQERVDLPLAIDSPHPLAIEVGLSLHRGRAFLNSLSLEKNRWEELLPIIKEYRPLIVALCLDEAGLPSTPEETLQLAQRISTKLEKEGLDPADVFLDPLVRPLGVDYKAGTLFLLSLRLIKQELPAFRTIAGISNISFGLPLRSLLNRSLLSLAVEVGLDAAIIDPCDSEMTASLKASEALCGRDINLKAYLSYARERKRTQKNQLP